MKIDYTKDAKAVELEQVIIGLNAFIAQFDIRGGTHHGYIREFNCGDHPSFAWDLGGRLYCVGDESYQGLSADERKLMTIDGQPVANAPLAASGTGGSILPVVLDPKGCDGPVGYIGCSRC